MIMNAQQNMSHVLLTLCIAVSIVTTLGCSKSADLLATANDDYPDEPRATSRARIVSVVRDHRSRQYRLIEQFLDYAESIKDDASAKTAIERIDQMCRDYGKGKTVNLVAEMTQDEYDALRNELIERNKEEFISILERWKRADEILRRVSSNTNLSYPLKQQFQAAARKVNLISGVSIHPQHRWPVDRTVSIFIEDKRDAEEYLHYMQRNYDFQLAVGEFKNGVHKIRFGEVNDFENFVYRLDFGEVVRTNPQTRAILLKLSAEDIEFLKKDRRERLANEQRQIDEEKDQQEAERVARQQEAALKVSIDLDTAVAARHKVMANILQILKSMKTVQTTADGAERINGLRHEYSRATANANRYLANYRKQALSDYEFEDKAPQYLRQMQAEIDRIRSDDMMRVSFSRYLGPHQTAEFMLTDETRHTNYTNPAQDPQHENYLLANLLDLKISDSRDRDKAINRLSLMDPAKVQDEELRKEIAKALQGYFTTASSYDKPKAIMPLAKWGGESSVAILLRSLEEDLDSRNAEVFFEALALYPSPEVATAVSGYVGHRFAHEHACKCLLRMGEVAEEAVMKIAPSNDEKVSVAAVIILGEIGTQQCIPLLRKAVASRNQDVKQAAVRAIKKVQAREPGS